MTTVHFQGRIDENGVIHVPGGVNLPPGPVEVILKPVIQSPTPGDKSPAVEERSEGKNLFQQLAELAQGEDWSDAPTDLAENHDHYAHGAPKGVDSQ